MKNKFLISIIFFLNISALSNTAQSQEMICEDGSDLVPKDFCMGEDCPVPTMVCKTGVRQFTVERATYEKIRKSNDELIKMINSLTAINNSLTSVPNLAQNSSDTKTLLDNTITSFNKELRSSINSRFDKLPQELLANEEMKKFKADIIQEIDNKIKSK